MNLKKPKFWDKQIGIVSILLLPLSLVFILLSFLKKKLTKQFIFKIPIICIGNIYIGGTGKTPTCILLANELFKLGRKPVIIRKFYKSHNDEYGLIKRHFKNLILNKKRVKGLSEAENLGHDVAILDDGLQDFSIKKNLNIVCFNSNQLIGNGLVLPSGPLRENLKTLINADIVIINGKKNKVFEERICKINKNLKIFYSYYVPDNLDKFKSDKYIALVGIGNPENFFQLIKENNIKIIKKIILPDHYKFSKNEFQKITDEARENNCRIILTEKDYYKIKDFDKDLVDCLKISLMIENQKKLISLIEQKI